MTFYLFRDNVTGEDFFVEAKTCEEACDIATDLFDEPVLVDIMTEEESEWYPYDVY